MIIKNILKITYLKYFLINPLSFVLNLKIKYKSSYTYNFAFKNMNTKPPNILVYTGDNCPKLFNEIYDDLQKCLQNDRYTIYHLLESEVIDQPWMENSLLLIVSSEIVKNSITKVFEKYLRNFGNILLICSKLDDSFVGNKCFQILDNNALTSINFKNVKNVILYRGKYSYNCGTALYYDNSLKPLVHKFSCNKNILICSEVYLDRDFLLPVVPSDYNSNERLLILKSIISEEFGLEVKSDDFMPQLIPGSFFNKNEFEIIKQLNKEDESTSPEISLFHECKLNYFDEFITLPIYFYEKSNHPLIFNVDTYYSKLNSKNFGHKLVYFPVITSTMDVAEQLSEYEGIVIVGGYQIKGKGRRNNKWISPKGCAMFTLHFTVSLHSNLGKRMSLLQHIASLAVVHGIRSQPTFKDLDVKIKWPNDIYYKGIKLAGLIATSVIQNNIAHVYIGWGINVENSYPTSCLNDVIDKFNLENTSSLPHLCIEEVVASTLCQMESFVKDFIEYGPEKFFTFYYSYWMHSNQEVTLKNLNKQGIVLGLDEYGFLRVKTNEGEILTLQPDGNRFDIMKNLIYSP